MASLGPDGGFGIYVHWPFCAAKCPYCDFNSHVRRAVDQTRWVTAFDRELAELAAQIDRHTVDSIFFGGGTPSLMDPRTVEGIIRSISRYWSVPDGTEITLEANPTSVEAARFAAYADLGINRVSMGIQALNDGDLRRLGRMHSTQEALAAFDVARRQFNRVSFDLIYARQDQGLAAWEAELSLALRLAVDHLSLYQLTIEPGTAFGALHHAGRLRDLPDDDLGADLYDVTQNLCTSAGMPAYEISNHARPGAESRHNLIYWRGGEYVGVGPGAHGRVSIDGKRIATETIQNPEAWLDAVERKGSGQTLRQPVSTEDQAIEYLMMGLRLAGGVDKRRLTALSLDGSVLEDLCEEGFLTQTADKIATTPTGRPVLNAILRRLLA